MQEKTKKGIITALFIGAIGFFAYKAFAKPTTLSGGNGGGANGGIDCKDSFCKYIVNTSSENLNVRKGAGSNFEVIDSLPKGKEVIAKPVAGNTAWSCISKSGSACDSGYVSTNYLKKV
jgi:uncharacterized protein YgiM (DUF1202 family)